MDSEPLCQVNARMVDMYGAYSCMAMKALLPLDRQEEHSREIAESELPEIVPLSLN